MEAVHIQVAPDEDGQWCVSVQSLRWERYSRLHGRGATRAGALRNLHDQLLNLAAAVMKKAAETPQIS